MFQVPVNYPVQAGKQNWAASPQMVFVPNSSPDGVMTPMAPFQLPVLQKNSSTTSETSAQGETKSPPNQAAPSQSPPTPLFPQPFQPVQLIAQPPPVMMNYNGQNQPLVPVIQVQTPNGPQFQPVYYLTEQQMAGTPPIPIPASQFLIPGSAEQHPLMQDACIKNKGSRSGSLSFDARSMSYSRDGSEISDSGDAKQFSPLQASCLHRTSSDASRDGFGSDCSNSHLGSENFGDSFCSDEEGKADVASPAKLFYPTQTTTKSPPPGLVKPFESRHASQQTYRSQSSNVPQTRKKMDTSELNSDHNLEHKRYVHDHMSHSKGYFHSPDRSGKKRPTSKERQEELYKTELCNYWINGQKCRFGKRCIFAHGQHELRMPKRKVERNRMRAPFRRHIVSILNKLTDSNFDTLSTDLLCSAVEDIRNDEHLSQQLVKSIFSKALQSSLPQNLYAEMWRKLLNVHPMAQTLANQMMDACLSEYRKPRHKDAGIETMKWIAELCKKKTDISNDMVHKILSDMFDENQSEEKVELWCKLIESLKSTVDTSRYFPQLNKLKKKFSARTRFMIMDLEDLKKRNWIPRA